VQTPAMMGSGFLPQFDGFAPFAVTSVIAFRLSTRRYGASQKYRFVHSEPKRYISIRGPLTRLS
jgi:hypothetical protein